MLQVMVDVGCEACYNPAVDDRPLKMSEINGDHVDQWWMLGCSRCSNKVTVYLDYTMERND